MCCGDSLAISILVSLLIGICIESIIRTRLRRARARRRSGGRSGKRFSSYRDVLKTIALLFLIGSVLGLPTASASDGVDVVLVVSISPRSIVGYGYVSISVVVVNETSFVVGITNATNPFMSLYMKNAEPVSWSGMEVTELNETILASIPIAYNARADMVFRVLGSYAEVRLVVPPIPLRFSIYLNGAEVPCHYPPCSVTMVVLNKGIIDVYSECIDTISGVVIAINASGLEELCYAYAVYSDGSRYRLDLWRRDGVYFSQLPRHGCPQRIDLLCSGTSIPIPVLDLSPQIFASRSMRKTMIAIFSPLPVKGGVVRVVYRDGHREIPISGGSAFVVDTPPLGKVFVEARIRVSTENTVLLKHISGEMVGYASTVLDEPRATILPRMAMESISTAPYVALAGILIALIVVGIRCMLIGTTAELRRFLEIFGAPVVAWSICFAITSITAYSTKGFSDVVEMVDDVVGASMFVYNSVMGALWMVVFVVPMSIVGALLAVMGYMYTVGINPFTAPILTIVVGSLTVFADRYRAMLEEFSRHVGMESEVYASILSPVLLSQLVLVLATIVFVVLPYLSSIVLPFASVPGATRVLVAISSGFALAPFIAWTGLKLLKSVISVPSGIVVSMVSPILGKLSMAVGLAMMGRTAEGAGILVDAFRMLFVAPSVLWAPLILVVAIFTASIVSAMLIASTIETGVVVLGRRLGSAIEAVVRNIMRPMF